MVDPDNYGSSDEGKGKTVCVEFSSPNIAKPFHIGHLSTTVLGGALYRIYNFLGYNAVGINHLGDWGTQNGKQIFITGHSEYDVDTLKNEYVRDVNAGMNPLVPENYFPNDDPTLPPLVSWRGHAHLLFSNWLNYFVYQSTPYDIKNLSET